MLTIILLNFTAAFWNLEIYLENTGDNWLNGLAACLSLIFTCEMARRTKRRNANL